MKKAKLMLYSLLLITTISTSLAFKTNKFTLHYIYTGSLNSGVCTQTVNGAAITNGPNRNVAASAIPLTTGCPNVYTFAISNL